MYAGGALVLLWFSSTIVSAVNAVPLVSDSNIYQRTCVGGLIHFAGCLPYQDNYATA